MSSKQWVLSMVLVLPALGACGGAEALDPAAAQTLQQQVRELAVTTQTGNYELALGQAESLRTEVQQAQDSGAVTPGRASRIQQNITAFIESIKPAETTTPVTPSTSEPAPSTQPSPIPTFSAPAKGVREDSRDPGETQTDREREAAEDAAEAEQKRIEEAQKRAEDEAKERQKQEEENREDD